MGYDNRKNHLTGNVLSDEWYTPQFIVDKCLEIIKKEYNSPTVLLPFDTEKSLFVKTLMKENYDICFNFNDFLENYYYFDVLVTNPPFSIKQQVFEKCLKYRKDFILVLPETFIFSVGFYDLIEKYGFKYKIYSPKQRVYFIDENGNQNRPNFHSIIVYVSNQFTENKIEHFYSDIK